MTDLKIVIIGDALCGKTSLLHAYANKKFSRDLPPTVIDDYVFNFDTLRGPINVTIMDTAGQEEYRNVRPRLSIL